MYKLLILDEKEIPIFERKFFLPDTAFETNEYKEAIQNGYKIELTKI